MALTLLLKSRPKDWTSFWDVHAVGMTKAKRMKFMYFFDWILTHWPYRFAVLIGRICCLVRFSVHKCLATYTTYSTTSIKPVSQWADLLHCQEMALQKCRTWVWWSMSWGEWGRERGWVAGWLRAGASKTDLSLDVKAHILKGIWDSVDSV